MDRKQPSIVLLWVLSTLVIIAFVAIMFRWV
jgi:hypothetical protein